MSDKHTVIRECGGIVHSDGNIFFTSVEQFMRAAQRLAAQPGEPVAWAVFVPNGQIRIWHTDSEPVRQLAAKEGLPLTPLYASPPPQQGEKEASGVAPCGNTPYDEGPFTLSTPADSPALGVRASAQPDYPECSGDPANCPENEGHGCCNRIPGVTGRAKAVEATDGGRMVSITVGGSTHTRTAEEWLALARADLRQRAGSPGVPPAPANDGSKWGNAKFGCAEGKKNG